MVKETPEWMEGHDAVSALGSTIKDPRYSPNPPRGDLDTCRLLVEWMVLVSKLEEQGQLEQ